MTAAVTNQGKVVLVLHKVDVRRRGECVVRGVSLQGQSPGLLFLMGAGGAGKSSLLAAMSGVDEGAALQLSGMAVLDGHDIAAGQVDVVRVPQRLRLDGEEPTLTRLADRFGVDGATAVQWVMQAGVEDAQALLEQPVIRLSVAFQRLLAVLATLHKTAQLYLIDEPTAGLDEAHLQPVRERLRELATQACVVVATHNRQDCLKLGGHTALLAGGTIQECSDTERFFSSPVSRAGQTYVQTGNCNLPGMAHPRNSSDGIWNLVPGLLCGMSRPGLTSAMTTQFRHLSDEDMGILVCLEERRTYALGELREHGLQHHHFPVPDMAPPNFSQAVDLCRLAEPAIRVNRGVAVHCRGGLGRTGTALAAILIWFGDTAEDAITKVRAAKPMAIQSMAQSRFLYEFAERISGWH